MKEVVDRIKEIAHAEGVPVLGIGPAKAMADEAPGFRPEDRLPGAQSLVCFGIPVPKGVYRPGPYGTETIWRAQSLHYRRLDSLSVRIAAIIEESGETALPVFG